MRKKKTDHTLAQDLPLVAIDIGSDSIRAMAAQLNPDYSLRILGYEESRKFDCVHRGVVTNTTNAGYMVSEVLNLLANRIGIAKLPTAFVLLGGASMASATVDSKRDQQKRQQEITAQLLEEMRQECTNKIEHAYPNIGVLGLIPSYCNLDEHIMDEHEVIGKQGQMIETHYSVFCGNHELRDKIEGTIDRAGRSIEQSFVRVEALLSAFATEDQSILEDGCAILDMGADTTTLSIYKGDEYRFTKVVPHGGNELNLLLMNRGLTAHYAEQLKVEYGTASPECVERDLTMRIPAQVAEGSISMTSRELATTLRLGLDTLLDPLLDELNKHRDDIRTVFITGGGSLLNGMEQYIQSKTSIQVLYGSHAMLLDQADDEYYKPRYSALIGALILGADYRQNHPGKPVKTAKIADKIIQLFIPDITDNNMNKPQ